MILERIFGERRASVLQTNPRDPVVAQWFGGGSNTAAGVDVSEDLAMQLSVVFACVRILAESVASLPFGMFREIAGGKERAVEHPLHSVIHDQPNRWQTSFEWREMMIGHCALRGNSYSEIVPGSARAVAELVPLHPGRVRPFVAPDGLLAYEYTPKDGRSRIILGSEMHHLRGLSSDGFVGLSPIDQIRESVGLTIAAEQHGARFYGSGSMPGGVLEHPGTLGPDAQERLRESWKQRHQGVARSHGVAVLEEGMKWQSVGIEPEKAQFLETRKFQLTDIARAFRIPPHMLADLERATFTNIEEQGLNFVVHTLRPWLVRWEQAIKRDLIVGTGFFAKFNVDGLLRGDTPSRFQAYAVGRNWGWLSVNDIRRLEDMNDIDGGDQYLVPLNMTTPEELTAEDGDNDQVNARNMVILDATRRVINAEVKALKRAVTASQDDGDLDSRCAEFLQGHVAWFESVMQSCLALVGKDVQEVRRHHIGYLARSLQQAVQTDTMGNFIEDWTRKGVEILTGEIYGH